MYSFLHLLLVEYIWGSSVPIALIQSVLVKKQLTVPVSPFWKIIYFSIRIIDDFLILFFFRIYFPLYKNISWFWMSLYHDMFNFSIRKIIGFVYLSLKYLHTSLYVRLKRILFLDNILSVSSFYSSIWLASQTQCTICCIVIGSYNSLRSILRIVKALLFIQHSHFARVIQLLSRFSRFSSWKSTCTFDHLL